MEYILSDIIELIGGGTPKTSVPEYWNGDIPWLSVKDFSGDYRYVYETEKCITEEGLNNSSTKYLNQDDIIVSARGTVGELAMIPYPMTFNQSCYGIRAKRQLVDPFYLYYLMKYNLGELKSKVHGSVFDTITKDTFKQIAVDVPALEIQKKVADLLGILDDKIETNDKINRNLEEQAKSIFKDRFIDFNPFGGVMPSDWRELTLADVSELSAGGDKPNNVSSTPTDELNIPIYSNGISNEGLYGFTDIPKIFEESVTVSARGTIGYVCLRQTPYLPIVRLVSLVPKGEYISAKYLYHWLESLHISGTGTTQLQLTVPDFKRTRIVMPTKELVDDFTEIVAPMYDEILRNKVQNSRLSEIRDTLLPKLMSGDLNVLDLDI